MGFTIRCNKCGANNEFTDNGKAYGSLIEISVDMRNSFGGNTVETIDIYCEHCYEYVRLEE